jgi:hypothetical protein
MVLTAFLLGFAGSLHCVVMCSPLTRAVGGAAWRDRFLYHSGRILTYASAGGLLALVGSLPGLEKGQRVFAIAVGALLILAASGMWVRLRIPIASGALTGISQALRSRFGKLLRTNSPASRFGLGVINGLLPCGLTALALAYCLGLAGFIDGFQFMVLFGLGTLPALFAGHWIVARLQRFFGLSPSSFNTVLLFFLGTMMIIRGGWMDTEVRGLPTLSEVGETITWCIP